MAIESARPEAAPKVPGAARVGNQPIPARDRATGRLVGKVAIITGASSGIGRAMARHFSAEGAMIAVVSRSDEGLAAWRELDTILPIKADVTQAKDVKHIVATAERHFGRIDILCNVAGINDLCYPLHETSDERWDEVLDLDLKAPFRLCRQVLPVMVRQASGAILNVGSYAALRGNHGPSYSAAKHGLTGLSMSIAVAYAAKGIRCNVINPGGVKTDIGKHSGGDYHPEGLQMFLDICGKFPVRWICDPEEIAPVALFLCSDEAKHINGAVVAVDGGMGAC